MTGIILRNKSSHTFTGRIDDLSIIQSTKTPVIGIPGSDSNVVQKMGLSNKRYKLKGYVTAQDPLSVGSETPTEFLNNNLNFTGSIYFYSDTLAQTLIAATCVFYENLEWEDTGDKPSERSFNLTLVELK